MCIKQAQTKHLTFARLGASEMVLNTGINSHYNSQHTVYYVWQWKASCIMWPIFIYKYMQLPFLLLGSIHSCHSFSMYCSLQLHVQPFLLFSELFLTYMDARRTGNTFQSHTSYAARIVTNYLRLSAPFFISVYLYLLSHKTNSNTHHGFLEDCEPVPCWFGGYPWLVPQLYM